MRLYDRRSLCVTDWSTPHNRTTADGIPAGPAFLRSGPKRYPLNGDEHMSEEPNEQPISESIRSYLTDERVFALDKAIRRRVFKLLIAAPRKRLPGRTGYKLLKSCSDRAVALMEEIADRHNVEYWLAIIRSMPRYPPLKETWLQYTTLGVIKYSRWQDDGSSFLVSAGERYDIAVRMTADDLDDAFRLCSLGSCLAETASKMRWAGKGARLTPDGTYDPLLHADDIVRVAVGHYDRRVPRSAHFAYEGILLENPHTAASDYIVNFVPYGQQVETPRRRMAPLHTLSLTPSK